MIQSPVSNWSCLRIFAGVDSYHLGNVQVFQCWFTVCMCVYVCALEKERGRIAKWLEHHPVNQKGHARLC